jgi:Rieske Fe-S protein
MTRPESDGGDDLVPVCALTRRRFVGAAATVTLVGCGPGAMPTKKLGKVEDNVFELELAKVPELATPGGMIAVQPDGLKKPLIVMRLEGEKFRVLSSKCPHLGCTVRWDNEEQRLRCPCHGSRFGDDGKVQKGPAKAPLREYPSQLQGTLLQVSVRET